MVVGPAPELDVKHPAKFSQEVLDVIDQIVPEGARILDPYAGVGYIHRLLDRSTFGIELEPEWGTVHPRSIIGNALHLPFKDHSWPWVVTSCSYGNRMADAHDAKEICKACKGTGFKHYGGDKFLCCVKCNGVGSRKYKRITYTHTLGRKLHSDNTGQLQWGKKYRDHHEHSWAEVVRVLESGGKFVLNIKNHWRNHTVQPVAEWHFTTLVRLGLTLERLEIVEVKGMGLGENRDARVPFEFVAVFGS